MLPFLFFVSLTYSTYGKVEAPNYNFDLKSLDIFMPGQSSAAAGKGEVLERDGARTQERFEISHVRYKFPVLTQVQEGKFLDFMARLPQYFSHDLFHQALINKLGKQDSYLNKDGTAVYQWKNRNGMRHIYAGACTITCFPLYYAVYPEGAEKKEPKPMLVRFLRLGTPE